MVDTRRSNVYLNTPHKKSHDTNTCVFQTGAKQNISATTNTTNKHNKHNNSQQNNVSVKHNNATTNMCYETMTLHKEERLRAQEGNAPHGNKMNETYLNTNIEADPTDIVLHISVAVCTYLSVAY